VKLREAVRVKLRDRSGVAVHVGEHAFSEKRRSESRLFLEFFKKFSEIFLYGSGLWKVERVVLNALARIPESFRG
jgi:hypothetical protein